MFDRVKIGICIPTAGMVRIEMLFSLYNTIRLMYDKPLWPEAKEVTHELLYAVGSQIPTTREYLATSAIDQGCTHILFIDDDLKWDAKAFELLARRRHSIVGVNYRVRLPPGRFTAIHLSEPGVKGVGTLK